MQSGFKKDIDNKGYRLLDDGTFVISDYNKSNPFSSFFPGIAGLRGIPMWAFYVNRNQGIASFGIKNKNYSILEFYAANNAYSLAATQGFRTFIKIKGKNSTVFYEPFANNPPDCGKEPEQKMYIRPHEIIFEDINRVLGLKTTVRYFTLPNEPIAAIMRTMEIENISGRNIIIEAIDGLSKIVPYWMSIDILKNMSTTAQAWTIVTNLKRNAPFYRLKVEINDKTDVTELRKGNFYFAFAASRGKAVKTRALVDPAFIFGEDTALQNPQAFMAHDDFKAPEKQSGSNKYPCAMSFLGLKLPKGAVVRLDSMTGHIDSEAKLNAFTARATKPGYIESKASENKAIIDSLTDPIATKSGLNAFDLYCRQTFLDNLIRGGTPILLDAGGRKLVYYVYSRKHGDLERDYNFFHISPSYYSQGNGSFRDMNQNKRSDIFFHPEIQEYNLEVFYNLIQLDGYNPLLVKGTSFYLNTKEKAARAIIAKCVEKKCREQAVNFFSKRFEPGGLLLFIEEKNLTLSVKKEEFLSAVLGASEIMHDSEHGEGYWVDHWTYNLDLLESYLAVYPEKLKSLLFAKKDFTFFDNAHTVVPRSDKYVNAAGKIRQFDSVVLDTKKSKLLRNRPFAPHLMRDKKGAGNVYRTTLAAKLICLIVNKIATLDPDGIGIEMEADKPGWYDALNGLPGVFGSSLCETFELKRLICFLQDNIDALKLDDSDGFYIPEEVDGFLEGIELLLKKSKRISDFDFWDKAAALKEKFRADTAHGVLGKEKLFTIGQMMSFFELAVEKINAGLARGKDKKTGLYYTYFSYEALSYRPNQRTSHKGWPCVEIKKFKRHPLPLFLEGEVHYLKTAEGRKDSARFYKLVKKSPLYDKTLGMYKVNAPLKAEPMDIGRCAVFSPGWLENESIWLHMEYKYLLELLKSGLYREFNNEFRKAGVCFLDPAVYGRNILENSSFISSSAFPDKNNWGRGFVARLSGSTAEFIEMWLVMTCGAKPFTAGNNGGLKLAFKPALAREYFDAKNEFSFVFLGHTAVVYHNPSKRDLFGESAKVRRMEITWHDGKKEIIEGGFAAGAQAFKVRELKAKLIDVYFF